MPRIHRRLLSSLLVLLAGALPAGAQTDYYNTDAGRPLRVEDAYSTERYAFELQLAPLRLERARGGIYSWGIEPEVAYGILPRTHVEIGAPLAFVDAGLAGRRSGLAGIELSALHTLNAETRTLPALGVAADLLLPVGSLGPDRAHPSLAGIATRTLPWARFHVNGRWTFGAAPDESPAAGLPQSAAELSRWMAGVAVDRTFPLRSLLVGAEVHALRPIDGERVHWDAAVGARYQLTPVFNMDFGLGRQLGGGEHSWFATVGLARAFALRALMPK